MNELKLLMLMMIFSLCVLAFGIRSMKVNPERITVVKMNEIRSAFIIGKSDLVRTLA